MSTACGQSSVEQEVAHAVGARGNKVAAALSALGQRSAFSQLIPALRSADGSKVVFDAVAKEGVRADALMTELQGLGAEITSVRGALVSGRIAASQIPRLNESVSLKWAKASLAAASVGLVTSEAVLAQNVQPLFERTGVNGTGITVGVLSDTFDSFDVQANGMPATTAAQDIANGDLPPNPIVLDDTGGPGSDEGRAMAQLIYDVAPGANIAFHTAFNGEADFAQGIIDLALAGSDVIVDDVIYFSEPMFQDGVIAQAIDTVNAWGVTYFSAAGNLARLSYESEFRAVSESGVTLHDFDPGPGVDTAQQVTIPPGSVAFLSFQWDEPFVSVNGTVGSASDLDVVVTSSAGVPLPDCLVNQDVFVCSAFGQDPNLGGDALEVFALLNANDVPESVNLSFVLNAGNAPGRIKYVNFGDEISIDEFVTQSGASVGHTLARGAVSVAAAFYQDTPAFGVNPPLVESFSSVGGTPTLFDIEGNRIFEVRQKPEVTGVDGANTSFFIPGFDFDGTGFFNFFGTSAAAPSVAGVAALYQQEAGGGILVETRRGTRFRMCVPDEINEPNDLENRTVRPDRVQRLLDRGGTLGPCRALAPAEITEALQVTAIDMDDPATAEFDVGFDFQTGTGLIDADAGFRFLFGN